MLINIETMERINCSVNGNPKYKINFTDRCDNTFHRGVTATDASYVYGISDRIINRDNVFADIHYTKGGKCIIDNIKIL